MRYGKTFRTAVKLNSYTLPRNSKGQRIQWKRNLDKTRCKIVRIQSGVFFSCPAPFLLRIAEVKAATVSDERLRNSRHSHKLRLKTLVRRLGCSSTRIPLEVIAGECRMNGSLWG